jgi:hypothetical protein
MSIKLDLDNLMEEFNLPNPSIEEIPVIDVPNVIDIQPTDIEDPDRLIATNISKANALLDHVIKEIDNGNFSPRMVEVAGQLINAINGSTSQLYTKSFNSATIKLKYDQLRLKERQIGLLEKVGNVTNQNIIITDREHILRMLKDASEQPKQIEQKI